MPIAWGGCWLRSPSRWRACPRRRRCWPAPARSRPICWSSRPPTAASPAASTPTILREARRQIRELTAQGKTVKVLTIGRKGRDGLKRDYSRLIVASHTEVGRRGVGYAEARTIADEVVTRFAAGEFDVARLIFNKFRSAISQIVTTRQLVPAAAPETEQADDETNGALYEFEPSEEEILAELLPTNLAVQIFTGLLENAASEQGARMTAMDNATRNAGDLIDALTTNYNRTRQAYITKELIEIISGAEAL